jgi:hypothetical protein
MTTPISDADLGTGDDSGANVFVEPPNADPVQAMMNCSDPNPTLVPLHGRSVAQLQARFDAENAARVAALEEAYAAELLAQAKAADAAERSFAVQRAQMEHLKHRISLLAADDDADPIAVLLAQMLGVLPPVNHGVIARRGGFGHDRTRGKDHQH